jgi:tetratricopeptide (TPR) repeat protein
MAAHEALDGRRQAFGLPTAVFGQTTNGHAGWEAIRAGKNEEAAASFGVAIRDEPRDPSLWPGAGLAAQLLGDTPKARESLEQALKLAPNFTTASLLLGGLLYRDGDLQGAIAFTRPRASTRRVTRRSTPGSRGYARSRHQKRDFSNRRARTSSAVQRTGG